MSFDNGYALLTGVSSHLYAPYLDVPIAETDARSLAEILYDPTYCGYPRAQTEVLYGERATRSNILDALEQLARDPRVHDTVFIFHVGHGDYSLDGDYNLICRDSKIEGNKVVSGTGVSQRELLERISQIQAQRVFIVFNSCHSGEISPALNLGDMFGKKILPSDSAKALLATGSGRVIITACRENQLSYIGKGETSFFTQALINGLRGEGITPRGGYISVFDLYSTVFVNVNQTVNENIGVSQEPELTILKGVGPMAVALYRGAEHTNLSVVEELAEFPKGDGVRVVEPDEVEHLYQIIVGQSGGINIVSGTQTTLKGKFTAGDSIQANRSQGFINKPEGPVEQHFGDKTNTGGGAYVRGNVNTGGGTFVGRDQYNVTRGLSAKEVGWLFTNIYSKIETDPQLDEIDKSNLKESIDDIQREAIKGEQADETFLARRLRNIQKTAPDILEMVLATLTSPTVGFAAAVRKAADKIKTSS